MHTAYPYTHELVALAKNSPNLYVDLCWAWAIDPYSTRDFVRHMLHAVPANKLFVFGGDTAWPMTAWAYALQARRWLTRTLQAEVDEHLLTERDALALATRLMMTNQYDCFNVAAKKAALRSMAGAAA
jgi:predicted TIM-barrel fold metal-dependent hydrolase